MLDDETFKTVGSQRVSDDILWQLADQQGTIRDIVDDNGVLRKHVEYDSFGQIAGETYRSKAGASIAATHAEAIDQLFDRKSGTGSLSWRRNRKRSCPAFCSCGEFG